MYEVVQYRLYANHSYDYNVICVVPTEELAKWIVNQCNIRKNRGGYHNNWGEYSYQEVENIEISSKKEFLSLMGWKKELTA